MTEYKIEYTPMVIDKDAVIRILDTHFAAYMRNIQNVNQNNSEEIVRIARLLNEIAGEIHILGKVKGTKSND